MNSLVPLISAVTLSIFHSAQAQDTSQTDAWDPGVQLRATSDTWLRPLPRQDAQQLSALPAGTGGLALAGCVDTGSEARPQPWCLLDTSEGPGWVAAAVLSENSSAEPAPSQSADGLPDEARVVVSNVSTRLNVRAGPGTGNPVVAQLRPGTILTRKDCQKGGTYNWCAVSHPDGGDPIGWAAVDFLEPATARALAQAETFDRIGHVSCRVTDGPETLSCPFGVAYGDGATAALTVFLPNEDEDVRIFDFFDGLYVLTDLDQARNEAPVMEVNTGNGATIVDIGAQHFVIPAGITRMAQESGGIGQ